MGENEQKKHISPNARQAWGLVECWDSRSKGDVDWAAAVGGDYSEKHFKAFVKRAAWQKKQALFGDDLASELERVREEILALARSESRTDEQRESIRKALCADPFATHKDIAEAAGLDDVFASEVSRMKRRLTNGGQVLTDAKASSYYKTRPPLEHVKEYQAAVERSTKHGTLQQRDFIRNMGVEHGAREMILCSSNELRELIAEAVKEGYQRIGGE